MNHLKLILNLIIFTKIKIFYKKKIPNSYSVYFKNYYLIKNEIISQK